MTPIYPVYIPSRGRSGRCKAAEALASAGVPCFVVVEPQEADEYRRHVSNVLVLPARDQGVVFVRNWIMKHAEGSGASRHWQLDDNVRGFYRYYKGLRIPCDAGPALRAVEVLSDRYRNVGIAGLNYAMFAIRTARLRAFTLNVHVYSCMLVSHALGAMFRGPLNEDVDICLQALSTGYCTILVNAFLIDKPRTMVIKGGNEAAYAGDGRLRGLRGLERRWPGVVHVDRRFQRAHFKIAKVWSQFSVPLQPVDDLVMPSGSDEFGLVLEQVQDVTGDRVKALLADARAANGISEP